MVIHCVEKFAHLDKKYLEYFAWFPYHLAIFKSGLFMLL